MSFRGNIAGLDRLAQNLARLGDVPARATKDVASGIATEIDKQFNAGTDSYGKPWKPLARSTLASGRHPPPGTDTRAMREGIKVLPRSGAGVVITTGPNYTQFFHAKRPILPRGTFPKTWRAVIESSVVAMFKRTTEGK